ncbi:hypothetical protein O181_032346 [Austropuccinia psidii MF-1]|uniref:Uncharacterized protein n=1 Tax=Austropuccinia psidii MF-1 TaxID=1389203 RepID=A0A9Q3CWM3_9BASI|nr:hypothetical protein [Austropuccinia psidii MF-1]
MLADKHTRNARLLANPSNLARGGPDQDALARTPLCPLKYQFVHPPPRPPLMVTSLLDWSEVIIRPMKDGNDERKFDLAPINKINQIPCNMSGTQWLEDLFCAKQPKFHLISTFDLSELTLPPFVEPAQTNEPPIPGPSTSSKPHEDIPTRDPEPEVAPTQSMEEPFGKSQLFLTFLLTISS